MRLSISLALVPAVTAILAPSAAAQGPLPGYGPGTARYRVVTETKASQTLMGQTQESQLRAQQVNTVVVTKAGDALTQVLTTDSASFSSEPAAPTPDAAELLGLKLTANMGVNGKVSTSSVSDKTGAANTSASATLLRSFLPRLKVGAVAGATWSDTSTSTRKQNGADVTTELTTNYTLVGDTTVSGAHAWKITSASTGKLSGAGNQQGADFTITGTIVAHGILVIGAGATLLGAQINSDVNMLADIPMASMQIPIMQKQITTVTKLP